MLVFLEIDQAGLMGGSSASLLGCNCERGLLLSSLEDIPGRRSIRRWRRSIFESLVNVWDFAPSDLLSFMSSTRSRNVIPYVSLQKFCYLVHLRNPGLLLTDMFQHNTSVFVWCSGAHKGNCTVDQLDHNHLLLEEASSQKIPESLLLVSQSRNLWRKWLWAPPQGVVLAFWSFWGTFYRQNTYSDILFFVPRKCLKCSRRGSWLCPSQPCGLLVVWHLFALTEVHTFSGFEELVQPGIVTSQEKQVSLSWIRQNSLFNQSPFNHSFQDFLQLFVE